MLTLAGMRRPGGNHLDRRRRLLPRDYLARPDGFGLDCHPAFVVPADGDATSAAVAQLQHELVLQWRDRGGRPSGASMGRRFGFSKQTWSRTVLGQRWMGETVLTALVHALRSSDVTPKR